jgi:FkbM family methyltransferase
MKLITIEDIVSQPLEIKNELLELFKKKDAISILDIGACTGEDSIRYKQLFPNATIIAFEPLAHNINVMKNHFKKYKVSDVTIEQLALSDYNGEANFHVSGGNPLADIDQTSTIIPKEWNKSSSLLEPTALLKDSFPWLEFPSVTKVTVKRLDSYLKEKGQTKVDFIHLDVQGAELSVLRGMGEYIAQVEAIWLEVENKPFYLGQPLKKDLHKFLTSNNFRLKKDTSINKSAGDCLYIRGNLVQRFINRLISPKQS